MKTQKLKTQTLDYASLTLALKPKSSIYTKTLFDFGPLICARWTVEIGLMMLLCWRVIGR